MDVVLLLVLKHIKPLAAVGFVVVESVYVPVEATVIKLPVDETPLNGVSSCQTLNGL